MLQNNFVNTKNTDDSFDSTPIIVLKKGKVELKIKNAAAIIKKIDELYPSDNSYTGWNINWNKYKRELSDKEIEKQIRWMESARNWFKEEVFGGLNDFEMSVTSEEIPKQEKENEVTTEEPEKISNFHPIDTLPPYQPPSQEVKSTNKNAYEIRESILSHALSWVQYVHDCNRASNSPISPPTPNEDYVLNVAQKFYKFVENRK